jgi:hypothetical protein
MQRFALFLVIGALAFATTAGATEDQGSAMAKPSRPQMLRAAGSADLARPSTIRPQASHGAMPWTANFAASASARLAASAARTPTASALATAATTRPAATASSRLAASAARIPATSRLAQAAAPTSPAAFHLAAASAGTHDASPTLHFAATSAAAMASRSGLNAAAPNSRVNASVSSRDTAGLMAPPSSAHNTAGTPTNLTRPAAPRPSPRMALANTGINHNTAQILAAKRMASTPAVPLTVVVRGARPQHGQYSR